MSILIDLIDQASRVKTARDLIRNKMVTLGIGTSADNLTEIAENLGEVAGHSAESSTVKAGETFQIPKGYHDGTTTVNGTSAAGTVGKLKAITVSAGADEQTVTPQEGYDGFSVVIVNPVDQQSYVPVSDLAARLSKI